MENARVIVLAGPAGDFAATTTSAGIVTFYGVDGNVDVRVITPGYLEYHVRLRVIEHQQLDIVLTLANPREIVEAVYTLTFQSLPDVLDQLTASTFYSMSGSVVLTGPPSRKAGPLDGTIEVLGPPPRSIPIASCRSDGHRFELVR